MHIAARDALRQAFKQLAEANPSFDDASLFGMVRQELRKRGSSFRPESLEDFDGLDNGAVDEVLSVLRGLITSLSAPNSAWQSRHGQSPPANS